MSKHKHHIIPRYKCEELGIDPDFDDNFVEVTREQHALIHWGYKCNDLSPLLEVCNPPQNVIDMIPLGDNRDMWAAQILAEGEIDGIDVSGENNPMWKGGITYDMKAYQQRPEYKEYREEYEARPERIAQKKEYMKEYEKTPERKAYMREYLKEYNNKLRQTPERKAYMREYLREYRLKKKAERQGEGTLEPHMK